MTKIPFVGLHAHSGLSLNDGLGYPQDHMDFAYENGAAALALTDHGHMNGLPYQVLHARKMKANGKTLSRSLALKRTSTLLWSNGEKNMKRQNKKRKKGLRTI